MADNADETILDANNPSDSSPDSDANTQAASSATNGEQAAPPAAGDTPLTDGQILERVKANQGEDSAPPADEAGKAADKPPAKEEPGAKKLADKTPEQQKAEDDKLPFHKHPRWIEQGEQLKSARAEIETLKKSAQTWEENKQWLQERGINQQEYPQILEQYATTRQAGVRHEDFVETMKWRALINTNPVEALRYAKEWLGQVEVAAGHVLPKDLQDAVAAGEITEAWAKRAAADRIEKTQATGTLESHNQLSEKNQQMQIQQQTSQWLESKCLNDPDLKASLPKPGEEADPAGRFAMLMEHFSFKAQNKMAQLKRGLAPQENLELLNAAYDTLGKRVSAFVPPKPARKAPLRNGSSTIPDLPADATEEQRDQRILAQVGSRHGGGF